MAFVLESGVIRAHPVIPAAFLTRLRRRRVPATSRRGRNPDRQPQRGAAHHQNPQLQRSSTRSSTSASPSRETSTTSRRPATLWLKTGARTRAQRNILAAAYPDATIPWRDLFGAYLSGAGVNALLPARGGDVLRFYLLKRRIRRCDVSDPRVSPRCRDDLRPRRLDRSACVGARNARLARRLRDPKAARG